MLLNEENCAGNVVPIPLAELRAVCYRWRQQASSCFFIWSKFTVSLDFLSDEPNVLNAVDDYLRNSAHHLLEVGLKADRRLTRNAEGIIQKLVTHSDRIQAIYLSFSDWGGLVDLFTRGAAFPRLRSLSINKGPANVTLPVTVDAHIQYLLTSMHLFQPMGLRPEYLRVLTMHCSCDQVSGLFDIVQAASSLEYLSVHVVPGEPFGTAASASRDQGNRVAVISNLHTLRLNLKDLTASHAVGRLLESLTLPHLKALYLSSPYTFSQHLTDILRAFLFRNNSTLETFGTTKISDHTLIPILHYLPTLKRLETQFPLSKKVLELLQADPSPREMDGNSCSEEDTHEHSHLLLPALTYLCTQLRSSNCTDDLIKMIKSRASNGNSLAAATLDVVSVIQPSFGLPDVITKLHALRALGLALQLRNLSLNIVP
jgi:hypothetical protein